MVSVPLLLSVVLLREFKVDNEVVSEVDNVAYITQLSN